ncbi:MAG TPA: recombinase family protein [Candidatus Baltobacteraceae bacterium]|nr:recombinase family protein [Candidatus Baltobacteraceae bacterium]
MADKCWLYLVVSSEAQEDTLDAQRRWGFEEAARIGVRVDPDGVFEGVASGKHGARTILLDLIARLRALPKSERPARVLMNRLDRTGRMPLDAISALNDIRKLGVTIRDRINGDYTFQRVIDQVGPIFQLLQAGFENEVRSDRSRAGHKRRRDEGKLIPSKPPYGVKRDERGKAIPDPKCARVVRKVFERWADGDSPAAILRWLREKAPPRIGRGGKEYHIRWSLSHVYKMVVLGTYRGVVIDEDLWQRAQSRKRKYSRPGPGGYVYPFSGIKCTCGHTLRARTNVSASRYRRRDGSEVIYTRSPIVWYVCGSLKHDGVRYLSFREERIEEQWLKMLRILSLKNAPWPTSQRATNLGPRIEMLTRRLDVLLARRDRVHAAFEDGTYDTKTMQRRLAAIDEEERKLEADIAAIQAQYERERQRLIDRDRAVALIKNAAKTYAKATREERARLNAALFAALGHPVITDAYRLTLP